MPSDYSSRTAQFEAEAPSPQLESAVGVSISDAEEIRLLDLLIVLAKQRKRVTVTFVGIVVLTMLYSLVLPNLYTAKTRILPPQQSQSLAMNLLGQVGPFLGMSPGDLGIRNTSDLYIAMLESQTVAEQLARRFGLMERYHEKLMSDAVEELRRRSAVSASRYGIITVTVDDTDPRVAAALANAYVEELFRLTQRLAVTEAAQRRLFFEQQLRTAKDDLARAESELRAVQETTGLIHPEGQAKAIIESIATLRGQITAKEVQVRGMRTFATSQNPDLQRAQAELQGLRAQLAAMERNKGSGNGDIQIPTSKVPEASLAYIRKYRDVKYYETIFELLAKQFEIAKIDEARNATIIQTLDRATPPELKSKPRRGLILLVAAVLAAFFSVFLAFLLEMGGRLLADPENLARLQVLRSYLLGSQRGRI